MRTPSLHPADAAIAAAADATVAGADGAPDGLARSAARSGGSGGLLPAGIAMRLLPVLLQLAEVRRKQRRFGEAESMCRRALGVAGMAYAPSHPEVAAVKNALAQVRCHFFGYARPCCRGRVALGSFFHTVYCCVLWRS